MPILEVKNLHYDVSDVAVLDDVTFAIQAGQIYGLLGANGSGKSTLIKIILGLVPPTDGDVKVSGAYVEDRSHMRHVGALIERASLYAHLTAIQNLKINSIQFNWVFLNSVFMKCWRLRDCRFMAKRRWVLFQLE